jgi:hypothetical protein
MAGNELPKDLVRARSRFQTWRRLRKGGSRIPSPLWRLAVGLASDHGVSRTATALKLDYYSLKKQVAAATDPPQPRRPGFVELPAPVMVGKQGLFELDNGSGATMRVQLMGYDAAEIEVLARSFWKR